MKKAIIIGSRGQDGQYLFQNLLKKNYEVIGLDLNTVDSASSRIKKTIDILRSKQVSHLLKQQKPDEVYYLAAFHQSSQDKADNDAEVFKKCLDVNVRGLFNFLEDIRRYSPMTRLFYAASSHIFGQPLCPVQDEKTPLQPHCIYGITKTAGLNLCRFYRQTHSVFASVGILYNHESPLRSPQFVSQKIVQTAIAIKHKREKKLVIGDLKVKIDWGYAADYVEAMRRILQLPQAGDFIISSGRAHTIEEFVKEVFALLQLDWRSFVEENPLLITKKLKNNLVGDHRKLTQATGWRPTVDLKGLIKIMVMEGLKNDAQK